MGTLPSFRPYARTLLAMVLPYPEKRQQKHMNPSEKAIVGNSLPATRPAVEMARNNVARTQRTRVNQGAAAAAESIVPSRTREDKDFTHP